MKAYAKSKPVETLKEHTYSLLRNLESIKNLYNIEIEKQTSVGMIWEYLQLICTYHDFGKIQSHFQRKIRLSIKNKDFQEEINQLNIRLKNTDIIELPHNLLSPGFLYPKIKEFNNEDVTTMLIRSILHHHSQTVLPELLKQKDLFVKIKNASEKDLKQNIDTMLNEFECPIEFSLNYIKFLNKNITPELKAKYIFLKGMLHRLDHAASAQVPVEIERILNPEKALLNYLENKVEESNRKNATCIKFIGLKPFQKKAEQYRNNSVLLAASTGMGKTEFAINWIGEDKAFYTLPLRVSVNAMYERFKEIFSVEKVGLLHGDSLFYFDSDNKNKDDLESIESNIKQTNVSKQFAMPITITTADQLFTSVFKWPGYEKIYATLMYSKVVLDEPQSYSPQTLAMIVKCLQEISILGGKFCFMSATIHPFIKKHLEKYCEVLKQEFNIEQKHKIKLCDNSIDELIPNILKALNDNKKILVIVNTVKKSQDLYKELIKKFNVSLDIKKIEEPDQTYLKELNLIPIKLLNSCFIKKDRDIKEKNIKEDFEKDTAVIWITTQIVEASLDIDYDVLFTEIATLDALIQRMGRIYRRSNRVITQSDLPNIYITTKDPSDKNYIYDEDIVSFTKNALQNYDNKILTEEDKQKLMDIVFNDTDREDITFFKKYKDAYSLLDRGFEADNKFEAEKLFRNIASITVIPKTVYEENEALIESSLSKIQDFSVKYPERVGALYILNNFTVNLPAYRMHNNSPEKLPLEKFKDIYRLNLVYNPFLGVIFDNNFAKII